MSVPTFAQRRKQWSSPPVDDVGYLPATEMLKWSDEQLLETVATMRHARYEGWRNWQGNWEVLFGYEQCVDLDVLDFGCGIGLEALRYAENGNRVTVADISRENVELAQRLLALHGVTAAGIVLDERRNFLPAEAFHLIVASGVIHHIPEPERVLRGMASWLKPDGQVRMMVYSDKAWRLATRSRPPREGSIEDHPDFERFWRHWDAVGGYADWYDEQRLRERFGEWFQVAWCEPITRDEEYLGAILVKR